MATTKTFTYISPSLVTYCKFVQDGIDYHNYNAKACGISFSGKSSILNGSKGDAYAALEVNLASIGVKIGQESPVL